MFRSDRLAATQIVCIGNGYGGRLFWYEILREDPVTDSIRKALLYIGYLGIPGAEVAVRQKLHHPSSRVRAAACRALGLLKDTPSMESLRRLETDPSARVRNEAHSALERIRGDGNGKGSALTVGDAQHDHLLLISDDSAHVQDQMTAMLSPFQLRFAYSSNLEETIEMARRLRPAVILTDNQKGRDNCSGLRMTSAISQDEDFEETGLIMVSADRVAGAFLWEGGDCFFLKPFVDAQALGGAIRSLAG